MGKSNKLSASEQVLVDAMRAQLQLMLQDLRADYRRLLAEAERVKQTGGAVGEIYQELHSLQGKEAHGPIKAKEDRRRR